jgi:hypothetical protein
LINRCKICLKRISLGDGYYLVIEASYCSKCYELYMPDSVAGDNNHWSHFKTRIQNGSDKPICGTDLSHKK